MGEESGDSPKQVQRYLKITELIPELLNYLDEQRLSFNPAFEIAFLKEEEQRIVLSAIEYTQSMLAILITYTIIDTKQWTCKEFTCKMTLSTKKQIIAIRQYQDRATGFVLGSLAAEATKSSSGRN